MNWASIAKQEAPAAPQPKLTDPSKGSRVAVLDANALIDGLRLEGLADRFVTTAEVLNEVRDQKTLQYLQTLPFEIETLEPSEDSVKAVLKFARATGDIHSLSRADVRLIALSRTLEVVTHGEGHLRQEPGEKVVVKHKKSKNGRGLPGWDFVPNAQEWEALDLIEGDSSQPQAQSRILGSGQASTSAPSAALTVESVLQQRAPAAAPAARKAPESESESEGEDDGWDTAKTGRQRRRHQRKEGRKKVAEEIKEIEEARAMREMELAMQKVAVSEPAAPSTDAPGVKLAPWAAAAAPAPSAPTPAAEDPAKAQEAEGEEEDEGEIFEVVSVSSGEEGAGEEEEDAFESNVQCVTADFAMQNVILQMGLRLTAKDGKRIKELSRYALRCSACFAVTKEMNKIFCPRCGNQALDKVNITVGPDGMEQFGVKRRHILRGTRYSLPKPKGGRVGSQVNPILREDILMTKAGKKIAKKLNKMDDGDPFAPEYNDETWHTINQATAGKGIAFATAGHKHNPNDRKFHRSNRRR